MVYSRNSMNVIGTTHRLFKASILHSGMILAPPVQAYILCFGHTWQFCKWSADSILHRGSEIRAQLLEGVDNAQEVFRTHIIFLGPLLVTQYGIHWNPINPPYLVQIFMLFPGFWARESGPVPSTIICCSYHQCKISWHDIQGGMVHNCDHQNNCIASCQRVWWVAEVGRKVHQTCLKPFLQKSGPCHSFMVLVCSLKPGRRGRCT